MRKSYLVTLIIGLSVAACSRAGTPVPTAILLPSPTSMPAQIPPSLIREVKLDTQTGTAYTLAWSPDGKRLAVASGGEITLLSADLKEILALFEPEGGALGFTWNADSTQLVTVNGFRNKTITVWNLDMANVELSESRKIGAETDQYGVSWSPDGKWLATLAGDNSQGVIQLWDASTWTEIRTFDLPYTKPRRALQWNSDSSKIYSAGESDLQLVVFALHIADGRVEELGKYHPVEAEAFAVSPDQNRIAISNPHGVVQIFDVVSGDMVTGTEAVPQAVDMAWHPSGETLAILGYKSTLQLWALSP